MSPTTPLPRVSRFCTQKTGQVFHEKTIAFEGVTEPDAKVMAGRYEADVNDEGHWRISWCSTRAATWPRSRHRQGGQSSEASVTVVYEPKDEEPPKTEFSAHQKYGSSSASPPYDVFYGTAKPGAGIFVESEYGGGRTEANSKGHWEIKVKFPEAPVGKEFRVVIESTDGGRAVFEFHRKGDKVEREFTANQKYGSCGEEVPYDVFFGTADAGERIWVESPYGGGVTEANSNGHWETQGRVPRGSAGQGLRSGGRSRERRAQGVHLRQYRRRWRALGRLGQPVLVSSTKHQVGREQPPLGSSTRGRSPLLDRVHGLFRNDSATPMVGMDTGYRPSIIP